MATRQTTALLSFEGPTLDSRGFVGPVMWRNDGGLHHYKHNQCLRSLLLHMQSCAWLKRKPSISRPYS